MLGDDGDEENQLAIVVRFVVAQCDFAVNFKNRNRTNSNAFFSSPVWGDDGERNAIVHVLIYRLFFFDTKISKNFLLIGTRVRNEAIFHFLLCM